MTTITPEDLLRAGPPLLFAMAIAETAVPAGILVPAGVALATGAFLAHQGLMAWEAVLLASMTGALVGDSLGYWLGRRGAFLLHRLPGPIGPLCARAERRTSRLFRGHALAAVLTGRLVAYVRTFMPPTAGASRLPYPRFLLCDAAGIVGWAALYVTIGVASAEGLRHVTG